MAKLFIIARKRRTFLVHVDEDFAELAVIIFAGAEINLVAPHNRLLRIALAAARQLVAAAGDLDDLLDDGFDALNHGLGHQAFDHVLGLIRLIGDELGGQRLRQLGAVAVERIGLHAQLP